MLYSYKNTSILYWSIFMLLNFWQVQRKEQRKAEKRAGRGEEKEEEKTS